MEDKKGIGLFGLIGMVISSCIGAGIFGLTAQLAKVSSPGASIIAWIITGIGFLALALSLNNLVQKRPDIKGIFGYATEACGPFAGFLSGWGYWLSAWLGNVAFATFMMSSIGYFYEPFVSGNTLPCIIIASVIMWALTILVIRGVESAAFINAIVMVTKVAALIIFIAFAVVLFNAGIFTQDFWGNVYNAAVEAGTAGAEAESLGSIGQQIVSCLIVMMWVFIGVEGATVMSSRARKKSDVGKAAVIGMLALLVVYMGASILPYGFMPYSEVAQLNTPSVLYVFDKMAPGWGGAFISIACVISVAGSWLSFTMLPAETTNEMAEAHLVPSSWGKLNSKNSPQFSLLIVGACTQAFLIVLLFSQNAYDFALSMCTVAIVVTWALAALYQVMISIKNKEAFQILIGVIALAFQIIGVAFNGWSFLLLTCVGYIPGFVVYSFARKEGNHKLGKGEIIAMAIITALGILGLVLLAMGIITI